MAKHPQRKRYLFCSNHGNEPDDCTHRILLGRFLWASTRLKHRPVLQAAQTLDETSWVLLLQKNLHKLLGVLGQLRACRFSKLITQAVQEHDRLIQHCTSQLDALLKRFQSRANALQWHETRMKLKPRAAA